MNNSAIPSCYETSFYTGFAQVLHTGFFSDLSLISFTIMNHNSGKLKLTHSAKSFHFSTKQTY